MCISTPSGPNFSCTLKGGKEQIDILGDRDYPGQRASRLGWKAEIQLRAHGKISGVSSINGYQEAALRL